MNLLPSTIRAIVARYPAVREHLTRDAKITFAVKADISDINRTYHDAITNALIAYFEGGPVGVSRSAMQRAMIQAFGDAFDAGWIDGGGKLPIDDDALEWIEGRLNQESQYIGGLFEEAKQLRKQEDFDYFRWISAKADAYTHTARAIYGQARLLASENVTLEFGGIDGKENCATCAKLRGKRHKVAYILARDLFPYPGNKKFECLCYNCDHFWFNPKTGERYTG